MSLREGQLNTPEKGSPVSCARPSTGSTSRVYEELVVIFNGLEPAIPVNHDIYEMQMTNVWVCPDIKTSTSICRAIELRESRSPVGMHWCPCMTPILIGLCTTVIDTGNAGLCHFFHLEVRLWGKILHGPHHNLP